VVVTFDGFVQSSAGKKLSYLGPWFFMVFFFILISNLSALVPTVRPPTADWATTLPLAMVSFVLIQVMGCKYQGKAYLRSIFLEPHIAFAPLNILGEVARPISLSFRLFGNMMAGVILIGLLYGIAPLVVRIGLPVVLHGYFDLFAAILQTYIFCILGLSFIGVAAGAD